MIRQAISCDICGAEKKQTNHWFVVCEAGGELRLSGWNSRVKLRGSTKHRCGQTCLHKLIDEFLARSISGRVAASSAECSEPVPLRSEVDASLASPAAWGEPKSSARLITPPAPVVPRVAVASAAAIAPRPVAAPASIVALQPRLVTDAPPVAIPPHSEDAPDYTSRRWRAEAWERERNRESRGADRHSEAARRRSRF